METDPRDLVPDGVVKLAFDDGMPTAKAWRTHLKLTRAEVARKFDSSEAAYALIEEGPMSNESIRKRVAAALGIRPQQLDW